MTKKSAARVFRDKQQADEHKKLKEEGRKGWDELMNLSNNILAGLAVEIALKDPLRNKVLMSHLSNDEGKDLAMKVRLLDQDLRTMLEKFQALRKQHENKSGAEVNFDEVMVGYQLAIDYERFQQEYDAFIIPTKSDIIQHINNAEHRMATRMKELEAAKETNTETTDA